MDNNLQADIPTEAWELLVNFPSPEQMQRAADLIVAAELEQLLDEARDPIERYDLQGLLHVVQARVQYLRQP